MQILSVCPEIVGGLAPLTTCLAAKARAFGFGENQISDLLKSIPNNLSNAHCFFDRSQNLWRYEFGHYFQFEKAELHGTHMWRRVDELLRVLNCCTQRLSPAKLHEYLTRLDNPKKHAEVIAEMFPILNLSETIAVDFEISGRGSGNQTIDWLIGPIGQREILIDVKSRTFDFIQQMDNPATEAVIADPRHETRRLFASLESKFKPADPGTQLQGAWITTLIQQEESELYAAFSELDETKIHFAILGDSNAGGYILVRDEANRLLLAENFGIIEDRRFVFTR